jgi:TrmH family RNA methyltransferase
MGAVFSVPLARAAGPAALPGTTVALDAGDEAVAALDTLALTELTLLVGAERDGLPADVLATCDHVARIPIVNHSLNAAMAATVGLYEASRMARK